MKKLITNPSPMITLAGAAIILGLCFLAASCITSSPEPPKENIIPVKTAAVTIKSVAVPVQTSGQLYPKAMIKLSFKVGGLIRELHVDEGETVEKGQLLASLNLAEIDARVNQAKNGWEKTKRDLERVENLYKDRAATLEQLQNCRTAYEVAESDLEIARFNLKYSHITAPSKGKILKRLAEKGEMVNVGSPIYLFGSTDDQWVIKAGISERDIVHIGLGDTAKVFFDAYANKEFSAAVTEISNAIDPASGTYEIELAVTDEGYRLMAGFVGKVSVEPSIREQFSIIPVDSIVEGDGQRGVVFTIKDNKAVRLHINVAHIFPETVAVRSGLEQVDSVVTSGAAYLRDGSIVKVSQ